MQHIQDKDPAFTIESTAGALAMEWAEVPPMDTDKPRVLFPGDLVLTRQQEDRLCEKVLEEFNRLDEQLGRTDTEVGSDGVPSFLSGVMINERTGNERKFLEKRMLYQLINENNLEHRKLLYPRSIFGKSNLVVPLARRIATQMGARAVNYFFGTDPWLETKPLGGDTDQELARKLQKLTDVKFLESGSTARLRRAVPSAFVVGEAIMKVVHATEREFFRKKMTVAVGPDGKPLLAVDGDPITQQDTFSMLEDGTSVLERDGQTPMPPGELVFAEVLLDQEIEHYSGPRVSQIYYRDFLCPINAPSIQEAECVIHVIEKTASQVAQAYMQSPGQSLDEVQRAVEALTDALGGSSESMTGDKGARVELGEEEYPESAEEVSEYLEAYIRVDADGDYLTEDVMVVLNRKTGHPIYYNYTANVTDDGRRPFRVITAKPVLNRWYGQGAIEQFEVHQETVDLLINRRNVGQGAAGRVTLWNASNTLEGQDDPDLKLNWGNTYTMLPGKKVEETLAVVYLDDNKYETLTQDLEFFMQLAMNESGVQHANDGQTMGLDSQKLATGIRNIEKSGQELFGVSISELEGGITDVAQCFVTTLYANLEDEETFEYFEGDVPVEMTVSGRDVQGLRFNVQVLLTRYRDEQALASYSQAYGLLFGEIPYYSLEPQMQLIAAPFMRSMLKALQIQRADDYVIPQPMPMGGGTLPGAPTGVPKQEKQAEPNL